MKILSIYIDIRDSSSLNLDEKLNKFTKMHNQFSSFKIVWDNISHRSTKFIGDGVLLTYNADSLGNKEEIIKLLELIDSKVSDVESENKIDIGIGISYGTALEEGNPNLLVSYSIDSAAWGSKITNKKYGSWTSWKWCLPLNRKDDEEHSVDTLKDLLLEKIKEEDRKKSGSGKNLWFKFK